MSRISFIVSYNFSKKYCFGLLQFSDQIVNWVNTEFITFSVLFDRWYGTDFFMKFHDIWILFPNFVAKYRDVSIKQLEKIEVSIGHCGTSAKIIFPKVLIHTSCGVRELFPKFTFGFVTLSEVCFFVT